MDMISCMLVSGQELLGVKAGETETHVLLEQCFSYVTWVPRDDAQALAQQGLSTHTAARLTLVPVSMLADGPLDLPVNKAAIAYTYVPCADAQALYAQCRGADAPQHVGTPGFAKA